MFNQDLTIVNKVFDTTRKLNTYVATPVKGFWSSNHGISISGVDLVKSDGFTCRILLSEKGYVDPKNYTGTGWTLKNDDYIVKGIVNSVSSISDLKGGYEAMKITNVAVKDYGTSDMQHFEVSGS